MRKTWLCGAILTVLAGALPTLGQSSDNPPIINSLSVYLLTNSGYVLINPATTVVKELDMLRIDVIVQDLDLQPTDQGSTQQVTFFNALVAEWFPYQTYFSPEPPPLGGTTGFAGDKPKFIAATWTQMSATTARLRMFIQIPEFNGVNQAHLRGLINYDVRWIVRFFVSNVEAPSDTDPIDSESFQLYAVEDPALRSAAPPAFADAGTDQTVAAGATVNLDGRNTFDSFNLGFSPLDPNVFEKANLTYVWEQLTGPAQVTPTYPDRTQSPWLAQVKLDVIGDYTYRLEVDDGFTPLPSLSTVAVHVVSQLPTNVVPRAVISAPTLPVTVGTIVTLNASASTDPNGDKLTYRWHQTDEVGGDLPTTQLQSLFLPATGTDTAIVTFEAVRAGTFYFTLIVSDGELTDKATTIVQVVEAQVSDETVSAGDSSGSTDLSNGSTDSSGGTSQTPVSACGGGLLPVALLPACLWLMRRRFH